MKDKFQAVELPTAYSREWDDHRESVETRDRVFNKHSVQDGEHVSPFDNGKVQVGLDGVEVKLVKGIDEAKFAQVVSYGLRATTGVNLNNEYSESDEDLAEMMEGGLQQALEADTLVFAVSGVSRAMTHQLVRSRRAAFNQQSQRATFYGNQPEVRLPESIWNNPRAREAALKSIETARQAYKIATEEDISYQDARNLLPIGTTNFILAVYTVREFINTYSYRACAGFQWEISHVFREMRREVLENHPKLRPHLEKNIKITCEKTGKCHFAGWETMEVHCSKPMAYEQNRTFKSTKYEIGGTETTPFQIVKELGPGDEALERILGLGYEEIYYQEALGKFQHWLENYADK